MEYDASFPYDAGASMQLMLDAHHYVLNNDVANWCESGDTYGDGDNGSPGFDGECQ